MDIKSKSNTNKLNRVESINTIYMPTSVHTSRSDALTLKLDDIADEVVDNALYARELAYNHIFN